MFGKLALTIEVELFLLPHTIARINTVPPVAAKLIATPQAFIGAFIFKMK